MSDKEAPEATTDDIEALKRELAELRGTNASLQAGITEERNRRVLADRARMSEAERFVASQQDSCEETISRLEGDIEGLTSRYAELADEPGNGKALAEISRKLAQSEARLLSESQRKEYLATERERAKMESDRAAQPAGRELANGAKIEAFSPAQKAWLEKHDRAFTDQAYLNRVNAAAQAATVLHGLTPDTPEWFASIEEAIGERRAAPTPPPAEDEGEEVATVDSPYSTPRQAAAPAADGELDYRVEKPQPRAAGPGSIAAAPPTRTIAGATPAGAKTGRTPALTAEEREVADSLYSAIPNPADRYKKYAQARAYVNQRQPNHFVN